MSDTTIIATIPKNGRESVRVALDKYQGFDLVDIRVFAHASDGESDPIATKKGVCIRVGKLPELMQALVDAHAEAKRRGLLE